jgi:pimeloyl-ACP methyl ester carboxylesterase
VTQVVGSSIDLALGELAKQIGDSALRPEHDAVLAALNGVLGDYLAETENPLAIEMHFSHDGAALEIEREALRAALPDAREKLVVLVHGSCMNDRQWLRLGHDHGAALERDLGATSAYLRYNSGLHVSTNGLELSELLEKLVGKWPVPVAELTLVGHSMGGLVLRSACHAAESAGHAWRGKLRAMVCLGTPHHGAPLERGGNWIDVLLAATRYSTPLARLGKIRSAGVTDLRFGNVLDEHWHGRDRFEPGGDPRTRLELPRSVRCHALAGTLSGEAGGALRGDGLVPVDSALGRHDDPELALEFPEANQSIAFGAGHLDLLDRADVYDTIRGWLSRADPLE